MLLLDEPFGALDAKVRAELRAWLRRLHDEVHVTTVLVTHDQEEAMDVADRIVVLNEGRIEQTGTPRELYERPANGFVMSFLGPVARLGEELVRPHDLRVTAEPRDGALEAMVDASSTSASRSAPSSSSPTARRWPSSSRATTPSRWSWRPATSSGSGTRSAPPESGGGARRANCIIEGRE